MSRLRVGHKPDDWRIEEPRQGRLSTQGFIVRGAPIESVRPRHKFGDGPAAPRVYRPPTVLRCGTFLRTNEPCGRRLDHAGHHASASTVARDNERRRTRDFGEKGLSLAGRNPDDEVVQAPSIEVPQ